MRPQKKGAKHRTSIGLQRGPAILRSFRFLWTSETNPYRLLDIVGVAQSDKTFSVDEIREKIQRSNGYVADVSECKLEPKVCALFSPR